MSIKDEFFKLEGEVTTLQSNLECLDTIVSRIATDKKVDRLTMESIVRMVPVVEDENVPLNSYTKLPTEQNLNASLESANIGRFLTILAIGAALGAIFLVFINLIKQDRLNERHEAVKKGNDKIKENDRKLKSKVSKVDSSETDASKKARIKAIEAGVLTSFMSDMKTASPESLRVLSALEPNGDLGKEMLAWAVRIPDQYKGLSNRFKELKSAIDAMFATRGEQAKDLARKLENSRLDTNDKFLVEIRNLENAWTNLLGGETFANVVTKELLETKEFYQLAMDSDKWLASYTRMIPKNIDRLDKEIERMEREASELDRYKHSVKEANRKEGVASKDEDGNTTVTNTGMSVNYYLSMELARSEEMIKQEINRMVLYRGMLNRLVFLQQKLVATRQHLQAQQDKALNEIFNEQQ